MNFSVLTLFPESVRSGLEFSIIKRAVEKELIDINYVDIRDFSEDKHKRVDDYPYGGGHGMIMKPEPIYRAYKHITTPDSFCIYLSPQGRVFDQEIAKGLLNKKHIILLCGHYEGVDQRVIEEIADAEISVGNYVLTGGEIPAMIIIDAVSRMIPGVLACEEAFKDESHFSNTLEYPQYTRPYEFLDRKVPDVLLSGNHKKIREWREQQSKVLTNNNKKMT